MVTHKTGDTIDLWHLNLDTIPEELPQVQGITSLILRGNFLKFLSNPFFECTWLERLNLGRNALEELPEAFGSLIYLKWLDLSYNKIRGLPFAFGELDNLTYLDIKNNKLSKILRKQVGPCETEDDCKFAATQAVNFMAQAVIDYQRMSITDMRFTTSICVPAHNGGPNVLIKNINPLGGSEPQRVLEMHPLARSMEPINYLPGEQVKPMSNGQQLVSQVVVGNDVVGNDKPVDREKVCPLLLRVFIANNRHNPITEFNNRNGGSVPPSELQMYTWMDCTLAELALLIKEINPDARRKGTTFDFALVQPDRVSPRYVLREIGNTQNGQRGIDDGKTLQQCKFEIGDFIDVAITLPGGGARRFGGPGHRGGAEGGDRFERRGARSPIRGRSPV